MTGSMHVGMALLAHARRGAHPTIVVVGTGKNVGKTVAVAALVDALQRTGSPFGLCSIGRDGEGIDALEGSAKPRLFLQPRALLATAAALLPAHPAVEVLDVPAERTALGPLAIARTRAAAYFEVAGPPSASAVRGVVDALFAHGAHTVVVDGAVDRIAAVREHDAIVVATGAASGPTLARVVADTATLVRCLRIPRVDPSRAALLLPGALTGGEAAALVRSGERRQVVVRDATRIAHDARPFTRPGSGLEVRCERALHPVACTVAPISSARSFEPKAFLRALADAVDLPCYDVYASAAS